MLKWFRTASASSGLIALCPGGDGIAAARVSRGAGTAPLLEWVDYLPATRSDTNRATALRQMLTTHGAHGQPSTSVLPTGDYHLLLLEAPAVPAEELREAARWRVKDLIDFDVEEAVDPFDVHRALRQVNPSPYMYFLRQPDRVLSKTMILEHVWDYAFDPQTNVVDVLVHRLRKKVDAGVDVSLIETVRGVGYRVALRCRGLG